MEPGLPRIVVLGATGAGKSTLARRLAQALVIPFVELDELFWGPEWTPAQPAAFRASVAAASAGPADYPFALVLANAASGAQVARGRMLRPRHATFSERGPLKRRAVLALLAGAAAGLAGPRGLTAQARARLGYLSGGRREDNLDNTLGVLRDSLREHGWRVGETLTIDERWASGDAAIMPRLARELIAERPDILVATGTTETRALHDLTKTIPIVFMQLAVDPVSVGFVQRISRPGGNVTGFMQWPHSLWGKRIDLLTELLGRPPRRLAWIGNAGNTGSAGNWADARDAARQAGFEIVRIEVSRAGDLERAFDTAKGRDALLVQFDFLFAVERRRISGLATRQRLPAIYENRMQALGGGLMSYGGDLRENFRQGATYVHRVLSGTPVGQLPVVQASRFELVINVPAARAIGLTVPERLLVRADELIE